MSTKKMVKKIDINGLTIPPLGDKNQNENIEDSSKKRRSMRITNSKQVSYRRKRDLDNPIPISLIDNNQFESLRSNYNQLLIKVLLLEERLSKLEKEINIKHKTRSTE